MTNREEKPFDLRDRTKNFALDVIEVVENLPQGLTSDVLGERLLGCVTSVAVNTRISKRTKSNSDFISKMSVIEEEIDECELLLEILETRELIAAEVAFDLRTEASELLAIVVSSLNKARSR
jgi:four helix bundle protein